MIRALEVTLTLDRPDARVLVELLTRSKPRTAREMRFVDHLMDRIPLDLHPKEV